MHGRYILDGKIPIPCEDLLTWGRWLEEHTPDRIVKQEYVGKYWVSTVFLALDHDFSGKGPPLLFESMAFNQDDNYEDTWTERTSTWELALEAHAAVCEWARKQQEQ